MQRRPHQIRALHKRWPARWFRASTLLDILQSGIRERSLATFALAAYLDELTLVTGYAGVHRHSAPARPGAAPDATAMAAAGISVRCLLAVDELNALYELPAYAGGEAGQAWSNGFVNKLKGFSTLRMVCPSAVAVLTWRPAGSAR